MEIPPNILRELEEKKAKAMLSGATSNVAVEEKGLEEKGQKGMKMEEMGMIPPISPIPPLLTPLLEAEPHRPSGGELFFGYLTKTAVFLAVFLTPLFFFTSSDAINLSKQILLSVLAMTALGAWVGKAVAGGRLVWRKTALAWPVALVGLAAILSSVFSSSFWVSFLGDTGRYVFSGAAIVSYLIIFMAAIQTFSRRDAYVAMALWLGSVFLASLYASLQFFGVYIIPGAAYQSRTFNTVGGPFDLGIFALSSAPFILHLLRSAAAKKIKIALAVFLAIQLVTAAIVDFRIGWLALAASALILILAGFKKRAEQMGERGEKGEKGEMGKISLPLAAVAIAVLLWFVRPPQIKDLVFPAEINPSYGASWDILVKTWQEKPVFGSGLETYPYVYAKFKNVALNQTNYWGVNFNNSAAEVVTWATTFGAFGALVWFVFAIWFLGYAWRRIGQSGIGPIGPIAASNAAAGILASWFFILVSKFFYATSLPLEFLFWFLPALLVLCDTNTRMHANDTNEDSIWSYRFQTGSIKTLTVFFVMLAVLLGSLAGGYFSVRRASAERTFIKAITRNGADETQTNAEKIDEVVNGIYAAVAANPYESRYFRVLATALFGKMNDVVAGINARPEGERQAKPEESALLQDLTVRTINAVQRANVLDPDNVSVAVDAAEAYRNLVPLVQGADDLAIQNYERSSGLEPINPFIKTQLGQLYLIKSNMFNQGLELDAEYADKARAVLDAALKLNPNYANARYFYALIQDYDGLKPEALQNFLILRQTNPDNQLIAQIVANLQNGFPALGIPPRPATPPQSPKAVETKGVPK
ncbi:MAG: O-antigen ligase family protein [Parcubacteria group bacterium]|nr:O-antigen ligase family protein [Parcubacteria group bacterium]